LQVLLQHSHQPVCCRQPAPSWCAPTRQAQGVEMKRCKVDGVGWIGYSQSFESGLDIRDNARSRGQGKNQRHRYLKGRGAMWKREENEKVELEMWEREVKEEGKNEVTAMNYCGRLKNRQGTWSCLNCLGRCLATKFTEPNPRSMTLNQLLLFTIFLCLIKYTSSTSLLWLPRYSRPCTWAAPLSLCIFITALTEIQHRTARELG
jgi:hypothetical protein